MAAYHDTGSGDKGPPSSPGQVQPCGTDDAYGKVSLSSDAAQQGRMHTRTTSANWFAMAAANPKELYGFAPISVQVRQRFPKAKTPRSAAPPPPTESDGQIDVYNRPLKPGENLFEAVDPMKEPKRFANILYGFTPNPGTDRRLVKDWEGKMPTAVANSREMGKMMNAAAKGQERRHTLQSDYRLPDANTRVRGQTWSSQPRGGYGHGHGHFKSGGRENVGLGHGRDGRHEEALFNRVRSLRLDAPDFAPR